MTNDKQIPIEFKNRLLFFQNQVNNKFSFLKDFGYSPDKEETGQTDNFKDYYSEFTLTNDETVIKIHFSTDIINGIKTAFPNLKNNELPVADSQITCSIWDKNAFMSVDAYIEKKFPEMSKDNFNFKVGSPDIESEITKVTKNYSDFFETNLRSVLEKKLIYDCYTDRFYDKVFKEIHYR